MKKYLQITVLLGAFSLIVFIKSAMGSQVPSVGANNTNSPSQRQSPPTPSNNSSSSNPPGSQSHLSTNSMTGVYKNGTYTGSTEDAFYGFIQVQAVISGGKISDVIFLQYPNDNRTSRFINSQAMPMLKSEAIQAQNANVDIISGASDSSAAFQRSLSNALSQAS